MFIFRSWNCVLCRSYCKLTPNKDAISIPRKHKTGYWEYCIACLNFILESELKGLMHMTCNCVVMTRSIYIYEYWNVLSYCFIRKYMAVAEIWKEYKLWSGKKRSHIKKFWNIHHRFVALLVCVQCFTLALHKCVYCSWTKSTSAC